MILGMPNTKPPIFDASTLDLALGAARDRDGGRHVERVRAHQHHIGDLDRDVGAGPDRQAHVGASEGGGVVHPVSDHGHGEPACLELGDLGVFVLGEDLGHHLVKPEVVTH